MKKTITLIFLVIISQNLFAQSSGNVNYRNNPNNKNNNTNHRNNTNLNNANINVQFQSTNNIIVSVKGLSNVKADAYVATFSLTQTGSKTKEVNELIDNRINIVKNGIKNLSNVSLFVDMISFVPIYEWEVDKKVFSKKTYNEVPKGFELKKNLHISYKDPNMLNQLIAICTNAEIYDLVKVDYSSQNLSEKRKELANKAKTFLQEKLKNYQELMGNEKQFVKTNVTDGYKVLYPMESYQSYQVFSSTSLNLKRGKNVNYSNKSTTLYYQPVLDKDFDFVINPTIVEPVIQVLYEVKLSLKLEEKIQTPITQTKPKKEYFLVTPAGEVKTLNIGQ